MRRIFTLSAALMCITAASLKTSAQCFTGGAFDPVVTNSFSTSAEGFSGDFLWSSSGSGELVSTPVSEGVEKTLISTTYFMPSSATTLAFSFKLAGTALVNSYSIDVLYFADGSIQSKEVCSGGSLTTTGSTHSFAVVAPAEIIGTAYQIKITFLSPSSGSKILNVDNFASNMEASAIILPVTITYFNAAMNNDGITLTWLVSGESGVQKYEVERSSNGKSFSKIGQVNANGSTVYTYIDANFLSGANYYRLKAVDHDGKFAYSKIVQFKTGTKGKKMRAFPMPANSEVTLYHDTAEGSAVIRILSLDGRVISTIIPATGVQQTDVNISSLATGVYIVRFQNGDGTVENLKIVKQ